MMFWNRNKKDKATIANEKKRFNHLLSVAEKLPVKALPDLIRAIVRPGNDSNLLIVFYVQIMPDDFVMQLHRF